MLHPIFEEASNIVREEFPNTQQVVFARVDCDQHCEYHCLTEEEKQIKCVRIKALSEFF